MGKAARQSTSQSKYLTLLIIIFTTVQEFTTASSHIINTHRSWHLLWCLAQTNCVLSVQLPPVHELKGTRACEELVSGATTLTECHAPFAERGVMMWQLAGPQDDRWHCGPGSLTIVLQVLGPKHQCVIISVPLLQCQHALSRTVLELLRLTVNVDGRERFLVM